MGVSWEDRRGPAVGELGGPVAGLTHARPVRFLRALLDEVGEDDVTGTSAEMAYRSLFAIFPLLLLSAAVVGLVGSLFGREELVLAVVGQVRPFLPGVIGAPTEGIAQELVARAPSYAVVGLMGAVWGAATGIGALIKGLNRAYDVERPRSTLHRHLIALISAIAIPLVGLALLAASVAGQGLMTWLGDLMGMPVTVAASLAALQAIAVAAVFFVGVSLVYRVLPALPQRARDVVPGAVVATAAWLVMTQAFGAYVANLDGYRATYGAFAGAIAFLLWLYLVSVVVLIGAEINALLLPSGRRRWDGLDTAGDAGDQQRQQGTERRRERGARHG